MAHVHVGLNLVFLVPGETGGMETAARAVIPELVRAAPEHRFTALVNREAAGEDFGCEQCVLPVDARNRIAWVRGEQQHVPRAARKLGIDLVHSLGSTAPVRGAFARVVTIHDLHYKLVPESHFGVRGLGMAVLVPAAARFSHRILADSQATHDDLVEHLGTSSAKIDVVPLGVSPAPAVAPTPAAELRERLGLGDRPVVLSVSAKRPHKNLLRLIEAVARLEPTPALVMPGYPTPYEAELRAAVERLGVHAAMPGWLPAADLEGLYALADVFCFPSLYEGFGLPVLEAMSRGVPVATSGRASLAEVAGDAAVIFDPESIEQIQAALARLLGDPSEADRLRAAGHARARTFTWERTAQLTLAAYERTLRSRSA